MNPISKLRIRYKYPRNYLFHLTLKEVHANIAPIVTESDIDLTRDTKMARQKEFDQDNRKTKGAYNVLADLVVSFSKPPSKDIKKPNFMFYTLGRDESLLKANSDYFGKDYVLKTLNRMKNIT